MSYNGEDLIMKKALYKVPNGKLLKIFLEDNGPKILSIKITGDFFVHPEENIEKLENELVGVEITENTLGNKIGDFFNKYPTSLFGLDTNSLISTIVAAHNQNH